MEEINLLEFFKYYLSKITIVITLILLIITAGNVYNLLKRKPLYESNTTIVLATEAKNDNSTSSTTYTDLQLNKNLVSTYSKIIKSRKVMQAVIDKEKIDYNYETLQKNVTVTSVDDTELIKISVSDEDSKLAEKIANAIVPIFSEEVKRIYKIDNVSVVDTAIASDEPYNINYLKENFIYILIGIVLGSGIIFIMFYFDTSIKTSEDIEEKLGLTVLGIVPKEEGE